MFTYCTITKKPSLQTVDSYIDTLFVQLMLHSDRSGKSGGEGYPVLFFKCATFLFLKKPFFHPFLCAVFLLQTQHKKRVT